MEEDPHVSLHWLLGYMGDIPIGYAAQPKHPTIGIGKYKWEEMALDMSTWPSQGNQIGKFLETIRGDCYLDFSELDTMGKAGRNIKKNMQEDWPQLVKIWQPFLDENGKKMPS